MKNWGPTTTIVMTPGAEDAIGRLEEAGGDPNVYLKRHFSSDWGEVGEDDWKQNDEMLLSDGMILSAYTFKTGDKIWIITDPGHEVTTILLPSEY